MKREAGCVRSTALTNNAMVSVPSQNKTSFSFMKPSDVFFLVWLPSYKQCPKDPGCFHLVALPSLRPLETSLHPFQWPINRRKSVEESMGGLLSHTQRPRTLLSLTSHQTSRSLMVTPNRKRRETIWSNKQPISTTQTIFIIAAASNNNYPSLSPQSASRAMLRGTYVSSTFPSYPSR